jgi:hypothetical protein
MSFNKISVLVPTRRRLDFLSRMLDSFNETATRKDQVELIFRCDNDDIESIEYLQKLNYPVLIGDRKDGYKSLPIFFNEMVEKATGDLFVCGNDDMLFKTKNWPQLVIDEANKYSDGLFNIGVSTGLNADKFPFSIVSRKLVEAMGLINDPRLLFSDIFLLDVAKHFNRAVTLENVIFYHDWAGHTNDETRREANQHEFSEVFADTEGNWSDAYRIKHDVVINETIKKVIDNMGPIYNSSPTDTLIGNKSASNFAGRVQRKIIRAAKKFTKKKPSVKNEITAPGWPPVGTLKYWQHGLPEETIHYNQEEINKLIGIMQEHQISQEQIILTSLNNGLPSIFWGNLFNKVAAISSSPHSEEFVSDGKYLHGYGSVGNSKFMYKFMEKIPTANVLVIDTTPYPSLISPYYLFRQIVTKPGMIVFINSMNLSPEHKFVYQFIAGLRDGTIDGSCHEIFDIVAPNGCGISYELIQ